MKSLALIVLVAAALCGCAGTNFTFEKARKVQVGMTCNDVQKIMGRPFMVTAVGTNEIWVYSYANGFGTARSVSFILNGGKVAEVPPIPSSFSNKGSAVAVP